MTTEPTQTLIESLILLNPPYLTVPNIMHDIYIPEDHYVPMENISQASKAQSSFLVSISAVAVGAKSLCCPIFSYSARVSGGRRPHYHAVISRRAATANHPRHEYVEGIILVSGVYSASTFRLSIEKRHSELAQTRCRAAAWACRHSQDNRSAELSSRALRMRTKWPWCSSRAKRSPSLKWRKEALLLVS